MSIRHLLEQLLQFCSYLHLFDVVVPSVIHSETISKTRKIGVIGTYSTIFSRAYTRSLEEINSDCSAVEVACPLFVPLIEEGWFSTSVAIEVARIYLEPFQKTEIDTLILGCTHYPIMAETIKGVVDNHLQLVFSGETVGSNLLAYLKKNNCKNKCFPNTFQEIGEIATEPIQICL